MIDKNIYELIAAYLAGETGKEENERLQEWIGLSDENRKTFEDMRLAWGVSLCDYGKMARIKEETLNNVLTKSRRIRLLRPAGVAAALFFALLLGGSAAAVLFRPEKIVETVIAEPEGDCVISTQPGQKAETTLPDGTKVWLNSGTVISYPVSYGIAKRTATLVEGEIYMEVTKNEEMPFVLNTSRGLVKVHGTSFNVRDYSSDNSMTISLKEGSIEYFSSDNKSKVLMSPGQKVVLDKSTNAVESSQEQDNSVSKTSSAMALQKCDAEIESIWHLGELKIEKENLMDVMAAMERWFGVEIEISGNLPRESYYWMTIKTESLREMLGLLNKITPLTYTINGKDVSVEIK